MKITTLITDEQILKEIGKRIARKRLQQNRKQSTLAREAGLSLRTVQRLEMGEAAIQLSGFLRVCRALGLMDRIESLIPEPIESPIELLKLRGKERKRAFEQKTSRSMKEEWKWGDVP